MTKIRLFVATKSGQEYDDVLRGDRFVGRGSKDVYDEYKEWAREGAVSDYRSFAKAFPRIANLKTVSLCKDGVVRRVYAVKENDVLEFAEEKDRQMFVGEETGKVWETYREGGGVCGKTEFSRRICAMFNLGTETKYVEGDYVRVFVAR